MRYWPVLTAWADIANILNPHTKKTYNNLVPCYSSVAMLTIPGTSLAVRPSFSLAAKLQSMTPKYRIPQVRSAAFNAQEKLSGLYISRTMGGTIGMSVNAPTHVARALVHETVQGSCSFFLIAIQDFQIETTSSSTSTMFHG